MRCEFKHCKRKATQADTYLNVWLCVDHFSFIGRITEDYQADSIDWDKLESFVIYI